MVRHILDIGSGRYIFDKQTLNSFIEEARKHSCEVTRAQENLSDPNDSDFESIFTEVMSLYHDYTMCQNVDLLVRLKCRLEEFSIRYNSHVLAAEVLNINSCLPYEHRISCTRNLPH